MTYDTDTCSYMKFEEIESQLIHTMKADILCVSETWLDQSISDLDIEIVNYAIHTHDRNRHGGGVAIYVSDSLAVSRRPDLEYDDIESVWLEITTDKKKILLASYYRPPISHGQRAIVIEHFLSKMSNSLTSAIASNPDCLSIAGDFNDRCQHWDDSHPNSELGRKLVEVINTLNLHQIIDEPTRYIEYSASILDLLITDSPGLLSNVAVAPPISTLDHCVISCRLAFTHTTDRVYSRKMWDYKHGNFQGLNATLSNHFSRMDFNNDDIDENVSNFNSVLLDCASYFIPNRIIKIRPRDKPYADRIRDRWHKKFQKTRNPQHYAVFREKRREAKHIRKHAKLEFQNKLMTSLTADNINPKDYWKTMKSVLGEKVKPGIGTLNVNGEQLVSAIEKASALNEFFSSQSRLDEPTTLPLVHNTTSQRLEQIRTSQEEVAHLIRVMDSSKANGPDEISIKLLQMTNPVISGSLAKLFNNSFTQGKVASKWKQANVTPVYKKGDRQIITNYRPISLISVLGKLQERIVFKSLFKFLSQNKLLTWHNSGFKPMDSAMNQLILVTHKIYTAIDNGQDVSIAFLDISKAFDRVWHRGLVNKLKTIGIRGQLLKWLTDYLENRCQRVVINGVQSPWLTIKAGVPQGSILGPLLFLVYVNDIVTNITSDIYLYADDTILMRIVTDPVQDILQLNVDLEHLNQWAKNG